MENIPIEKLSFEQIIVVIIVAVIGIVAVRITFKFDINKYLETKRNSYGQKIINACPHAKIVKAHEGQFALQSQYISPPGTIQWQCQRCGNIKYIQGDEIDRELEYYSKYPKKFREKEKQFVRLLKKSGQI